MHTRPAVGDYPEYFQGYIDKLPDGDVLDLLRVRHARMRELLVNAGESKGAFAYAEGKWTVKQLVSVSYWPQSGPALGLQATPSHWQPGSPLQLMSSR